MKDLGICIITLNTKEKVLACLASLFEKTQGLDLDVVVVDNNSQDGTVEAIRARFPSVRLIVNDSNLGYSKAVNQGLKAMQTRYYALLNPDTLVVNEAFHRLLQFMEEHPDAGICAPRVLNRDGSVQYQARRGEARPWNVVSYFSGLSRLFPSNPRFTGYLLTHLDESRVSEVWAVSGSCMMIRRAVIDQIGYLDERYFAYQEDADYCFQARKAGWKVYYVPQAEVIHYGGQGGSSINPYFSSYHWHRSYFLYYQKNLARDYPFWFNPIYYLAMLAKFLMALIGLAFGKDKVVGTRKP